MDTQQRNPHREQLSSDTSRPDAAPIAVPGSGLQSKPELSDRRSDPRPDQKPPSHLIHGLHSRGALPHLKREGVSYFVTFRLYGTLPREVLLQLKQEREAIMQEAVAHNRPLTWREQQALYNWYSERVDAHLDKGYGECWLKQPEIAKLVSTALCYFEDDRYDLHAWVVMPNHVHVVVQPRPSRTLSSILKSWKTYTAVHANRLLDRVGQTFWQSESYNHCCRTDEERGLCSHYTIRNPAAAGLCAEPCDWQWSSVYKASTSENLRSPAQA